MYEEDRVLALEQYNRIFDEVGDETAVLRLLVSPTRQAVNLARAYDSRDRGLQDGDLPPYLQVIEDIRRQAGDIAPVLPVVDDDQISLFEEPDAAASVFDDLDLNAVPEPEEDDVEKDVFGSIAFFPDEDKSDFRPAPRSPAPRVEAPAADTKTEEVEEFSDAVEAFLADFSIPEDPKAAPAEAAEPVSDDFSDGQTVDFAWEPPPSPVMDKRDEDIPSVLPHTERDSAPAGKDTIPNLPPLTRRKPIVALLILYILLAVPVALICIVLVAALAAVVLALAAAMLCVGFGGFVIVFTSFSVFADILVVFGLALVAAALGLLFFWIFVWLLVGAIPGIVRGVISLGRKLCYKEVAI